MFNVNQRVVSHEGKKGTVVNTTNDVRYPVKVIWDASDWDCFTKDGAFYPGGEQILFPAEDVVNETPSLQTFTDILLWAKTLSSGYDHFVTGGKVYYTDTDMEALYELYKSQERKR